MNAPTSEFVSTFSVDRHRADFPILGRMANDHPLIYFDNAASAQKPQYVLDRMNAFMREDYANVHRGLHYLSNVSTAAYEGARVAVAEFLNAPSSDQIVFTSGATDAINLVASSYLAPQVTSGDEIVVSLLEHHSNIVPWHFLRERQGACLRWIPINDSGVLDLAAYEALLSRGPKLVALTQMSNALGVVPPLSEMIAMAHTAGALVLVDGCQGAVHLSTDVTALDCDFYVFSGHKIYGPTGIGVLYSKREHLETMRPYRGGGEMIREVSCDAVHYGDIPFRFEAGTPPIIEAVGLHAALDYLSGLDFSGARAHEVSLGDATRSAIATLDGLVTYGCSGMSSIVAFNVLGVHAHDIATLLDQSGIAVRAGHHCAQPLMTQLGITASVRASFSFYNTHDEIALFVAALSQAIKIFR